MVTTSRYFIRHDYRDENGDEQTMWMFQYEEKCYVIDEGIVSYLANDFPEYSLFDLAVLSIFIKRIESVIFFSQQYAISIAQQEDRRVRLAKESQNTRSSLNEVSPSRIRGIFFEKDFNPKGTLSMGNLVSGMTEDCRWSGSWDNGVRAMEDRNY